MPKLDYAAGDRPSSVAAADLNGDGKADLAVANETSGTVSVLLNEGDGTFAPKVDYATGTSPRSLVATDLNGDGKRDLVIANYGGDTVGVLVNQGSGTFAPPPPTTPPAVGASSVAVADLNGDGRLDLAIAKPGQWHRERAAQPLPAVTPQRRIDD